MHPIFGNSCLPSKQHLGCTDLFSYLKRTSKRNRGSQCHIWLNIWVLILVLSFTSCVTLAKLQNPSESKFHHLLDNINRGFHGGSVIKNLPASAEDMALIPELGRSCRLQSSLACVPQLWSLGLRALGPQHMSLCASATEAHVPRAWALHQEKPLQWDACARH